MRHRLLDLGCMFVLLTAGVVGFRPVYGTDSVLVVGVLAVLLGLSLAALGAWRRWSTLTMGAVLVAAYLLLWGPVFAPRSTIGGVLPGPDTLPVLARAAVEVWKDVLTAEPPLGDRPWMLAAPVLLGMITATLAGTAALRSSRPWLALLPALVLLVTPIVLGTRETVAPVVQGTVFAVTALAWTAWRTVPGSADPLTPGVVADGRRDRNAHKRQTLRHGAIMLALGAALGLVVTPLLSGQADRAVAREAVDPPMDLRDFPSPLASFRSYVKDHAEDVLFSVDGLPVDGRVRIAVLDGYDGIVYNSAGAGSDPLVAVGTVLDESLDPHVLQTVTVQVGAYDGYWLPVLGQLGEVNVTDPDSDLQGTIYHGRSGDVLLAAGGTRPGDAYSLSVAPAPDVSVADLDGVPFAQLTQAEVTGVPDAVTAFATELIGASTEPVEQIRALSSGLSERGYFSNGLEGEAPSRAGHTGERLTALLTADQMVGDDEQYAVAMALMARSIGAPARVVMGFYPEDGKSGAVDLTGADVHAWVEVGFEGFGWVPFDPTPLPDQVVQEQSPEPQSSHRPQALDPPEPVEEPDEQPDPPITEEGEAESEEEGDEEEETSGFPWGAVVAGASFVVCLPLLLVIGAKVWRAHRRARSGPPVQRFNGGWQEILDTALDLGVTVPASATRREGAALLATHLAGERAGDLASRVDAATFGDQDTGAPEASEFWADAKLLRRDMGRSVGWWRRTKARCSPASLVRGRRHSKTHRAETRTAPPGRRVNPRRKRLVKGRS